MHHGAPAFFIIVIVALLFIAAMRGGSFESK